jgi:antitoxin FitA
MGQVVIRNIDDGVVERLKTRAAAQRKSLEQSLRELLTEAAKPSRTELTAEAERIRAMAPRRKKTGSYPTAESLIREDRDER